MVKSNSVNAEYSNTVLDTIMMYSLLLYPLFGSSFIFYRLIDTSIVRESILIFMTFLVLLRIVRYRRASVIRALWTTVAFTWMLLTVDNYAVAFQYLPYFLFLWVPTTNGDLKIFRKFIIFVGIFCAVGVFAQLIFPSLFRSIVLPQFQNYSQINKLEETFTNRSSYFGFVSDTSIAARYISIAIAYLVISMYADRNLKKLTNIVLLIIFTIAVLLTGKRIYVGGLVISLLIMYLAFAQITKKIKRILISLLIIVIIITLLPTIAQLLNIPALNRLAVVINMISTGEDLIGYRLILYDKAFAFFKQNPWLGIGWRQYRNSVQNYAGYSLNVHNIFLQLLCEIGIIGFVLFCLFFVKEYFQTRKLLKINIISYDMTLMLLFIQIYFLICGIAENELYVATGFAYYFVACALSRNKVRICCDQITLL